MDTLRSAEAVYAPAEVRTSRSTLIHDGAMRDRRHRNPRSRGLRMRSCGTAGARFMGYPDLLARLARASHGAERLFTRAWTQSGAHAGDRMRL